MTKINCFESKSFSRTPQTEAVLKCMHAGRTPSVHKLSNYEHILAMIWKLTYKYTSFKHKATVSPVPGRMRKLTWELRHLFRSQLSREPTCSMLVTVYQSLFRRILTFIEPITIQRNPSIPKVKILTIGWKFWSQNLGEKKRLKNFNINHKTVEYHCYLMG